jgi:ankyrin repeat protein
VPKLKIKYVVCLESGSESVKQVSLIAAIKHGDILAVRRELDRGANIHEKDSQGWTPLFHAAHKGDLHILQLLIGAGADVNHGSDTGFTALFSAVLGGHTEVVKRLLISGAKPSPVQGIKLRGYAPNAEIRRLLDDSK